MILLFLLVYAPIVSFLEQKGIIDGYSVGNPEQTPETAEGIASPVVYAMSFVRCKVENTFSNYMPYNSQLTAYVRDFKRALNKPVYDFYAEMQSNGTTTDTGKPGDSDTDVTTYAPYVNGDPESVFKDSMVKSHSSEYIGLERGLQILQGDAQAQRRKKPQLSRCRADDFGE